MELSPFRNEPFTDFSIPANRSRLEQALQELRGEIAKGGLTAHPIVDGEEFASSLVGESIDPCHPEISVGKVAYASVDDANRALASLRNGTTRWRAMGWQRRSEILLKVAEGMRKDKPALTALIIREVGKSWREADADVAEAIDFCEYYAREAIRLGVSQVMGNVPGEDNRYFYEPRGVVAVVAPWNFPLAIPCGMVVAALVTGNTTVLKPAEQSSLIAYHLAKLLLQAGVPGDAFAFLPGEGETVGKALVDSPEVDAICFTGSKAVGLSIIRSASEVRPGQRNVKKVIAEMGGKNAIVVDDDADLDEVIKGVIQSAFGFAGQKCSACSRLIVVGDAYEPLLSRLKDAVSDILCGDTAEPGTFLGPVIDEESQSRILALIKECEHTIPLLYKGTAKGAGYFVPPTIFRDVTPSAKVWREEIFGPVIAACKAKSFEDAISLAMESEYALTGAVYSRSPSHLAYARDNFRVGNLYLNRGSTGALVYRQPFGGARMSGVGSKAGGPDYLIQFVEPRTITENTMRRGFTP